MKLILALTFTVVSFSSFAAGTVDKLTSILSIGTHNGTNDQGDCTIKVQQVNYPTKSVTVTATDNVQETFKLVEDDSTYQSCSRNRSGGMNCGREKYFLQSDVYYIDDQQSAYIEKVLRTSLSGTDEGKLNVIVSDFTSIGGYVTEEKVECNINL
jgi:hypothetical protein